MLKKSFLLLFLLGTVAAGQANSVRQYPIDVNHSTVGFSVSIMDGLSRVNGKFTDFTITLTNDEKDITKSSGWWMSDINRVISSRVKRWYQLSGF